MTRRQGLHILVLGVLSFFLGCARLPENSVSPGWAPDLSFCCAVFPAEPWESVHKIEASIRGGVFSTLLGVTRGDPSERRLHSLLLTPEGFILFEAELRDGEIKTLQATAPFDSPAFTGGLMEDVTLLFLCPQGKPASWGERGDDSRTCLWEAPDGSRTEIKGLMEPGWRILRRDDQGNVTREVLLQGPFVRGLASRLELRAFKPAGYELRMTLLQTGP